MTITDEKLLDQFREGGLCEFCRRWQFRREPHHWKPKGIGGGSRLDVCFNIVALCNRCHAAHHAGHIPTAEDLLSIIARREGMPPGQIQEIIWRLLRTEHASETEGPRPDDRGGRGDDQVPGDSSQPGPGSGAVGVPAGEADTGWLPVDRRKL